MKKFLVMALKNAFDMAKEDAVELAKTIEDIFNGRKEVEDMSIDKYVRALFFELERERLLKLRREETKEKGKCIRKFYWSFNNSVIKEIAHLKIEEDTYKIYQKIPENAWITRSYCN